MMEIPAPPLFEGGGMENLRCAGVAREQGSDHSTEHGDRQRLDSACTTEGNKLRIDQPMPQREHQHLLARDSARFLRAPVRCVTTVVEAIPSMLPIVSRLLSQESRISCRLTVPAGEHYHAERCGHGPNQPHAFSNAVISAWIRPAQERGRLWR